MDTFADFVSIDSLLPFHNELRSYKLYKKFVKRLKKGGTFRGMPSPIKIVRVWDDKKYSILFRLLHDGHHRVLAMYDCGIKCIGPDEYVIMDFTLSDYLNPNLDVGWFTPIDPATHVRKANFFGIKNIVGSLLEHENERVELDYIEAHTENYMVVRLANHIMECDFAPIIEEDECWIITEGNRVLGCAHGSYEDVISYYTELYPEGLLTIKASLLVTITRR